MDVQKIKDRFSVIGNSTLLNRAIEVAIQVAPTDLSVLITGESGTGKEIFPQIIHQHSTRKHGPYFAVNCGAIPEGTIDSELFGHEKGAFTGASDKRAGYFEVANGGTIFLDEVADLPLSTQVRLLRVLETGEFLKVGSSATLKTNVRVIAATNVNIPLAIENNRFREDLYYRLNTVPIYVPPLRDRKEDVVLLFRKFASDFAEKYRMPAIQLDEEARAILQNYEWPGNIRQLKNITEQISIIERERNIYGEKLRDYLPDYQAVKLPALYKNQDEKSFSSEREILYKILFDLKKDMNEMKKLVFDIIQKNPDNIKLHDEHSSIFSKLYEDVEPVEHSFGATNFDLNRDKNIHIQDTHEVVEENLKIDSLEKEVIRKALEKHKGKRKLAARDIGISERTLYRKLKEYELNEF